MDLSSEAPEKSQYQPQTSESSAIPSKRIAHNFEMRLKNSDWKLRGDFGECWSKYVHSYIHIAKDVYLKIDQKLQYLHNVTSRDELRF